MKNGGVIIGAGIAGLAAGIFAQKRGLQLPIYERNREGSLGNHLLWMAPNGQRIFLPMELTYRKIANLANESSPSLDHT